MTAKDVLFCGIKGHVVCVRKADGIEIWRTHLRGSGLVSICIEEERIYAATRGHVYYLEIRTGDILWINDLPKLGYGSSVMGTPNQGAVAALNVIAQQQAAMIAAVGAAGAGAAAASG